MTVYTYPCTPWDRPRNLLAALGSFWSETYSGRDQIESIVRAKGQIENQTAQDLLETVAALSRYTVPIFHRDNWYPLRLLRSCRNATVVSVPKYDGSLTYDGKHRFDRPLNVKESHTWPLPAGLVEVNMIFNRFTEPSLTWSDGTEFETTDEAVTFYANPFDDARVTKQPVYEDGVAVDEEALLWVFRGGFDWDQIYRQFAYVLGIRLQSSSGYRDLMNAIFDALVGGTTRRQMELAVSAMTGIPLVLETQEIVEQVANDGKHRLVVTDQHVYRFALTTMPIVSVGDTVHAGDSLVDALDIHEFNRGVTPDGLQALAMGPGFLSACYYGDLVFENKEVPLEVTEAEDDPYGYTYVKFGLGGFPLDVQRFFDDIHERGITAAEAALDPCDDVDVITIPGDECVGIPTQEIRLGTLAHRLDRRVEKIGEPTALALPATINPLQFLVENVLRNNVTVIRVRVSDLGRDALGLHVARFFHKVVPPHTAVIFVMEVVPDAEEIDPVDNVEEQLGTFQGMTPLDDEIQESSVDDSFIGARRISFTCR